MASSIFGDPARQAASAMHGDPQALYDKLMATNSQFARFAASCKGKTMEQVAAEHGIPLQAVMKAMGR